ncbi:MAG: hypothetical protein JWQ90_4174 [Hydrocarboniphaga sp.]|nr:hypothetical protein [Hydrocarboniphaga sp.]
MKRKSKQALWTRRIRAFEARGQTRAAYCRQHGLAVRSLDYWRRRLSSVSEAAAAAAVPAFVPLRVSSPAPLTEALLLECSGGARLRLPRDCDPAWLAQLLTGLR